VAYTTVTTEVHQSLDIHGQGAAQIAFHRVLGYLTAYGLDFHLGQILDFHVRFDTSIRTNLARPGRPDAINGGQGNYCVFLWWNINPGYTSHEFFLLNETTGRGFRERATIPAIASILNQKPSIRAETGA
jgi:hypothetical protein